MVEFSDELLSLLSRAGFRSNGQATPEHIHRIETAFGVSIPDGFRELWMVADGMSSDGMDLLSLSALECYVDVFVEGFAGEFGYVPFGDCNESNPYVFCCQDPLRGFVTQIFHDNSPRLVCRGLQRFLHLVIEARGQDVDIGMLPGDFNFSAPDRATEDATTAKDLVRVAEGCNRSERKREVALRFAAQLFGPGQEDDLANLIKIGDEHTRSTVISRWQGLKTVAATEHLHQDREEFEGFLVELRNSIEAAGLQTETDPRGEFRLKPGNIGLNFGMLFADRHRPGARDEWIDCFKKWVS